jgi:hypothetical protein
MLISQEQSEIKAARDLIAKAELKRIRLRECNCKLEGEEINLRAPFGLAHSFNAAASPVIDRTLRIEVAFCFQGFDSSEQKASLFSIKCSFELDYEIEDGYQPPSDAIDAFKNGNAIFNCWPYARECVQSLTGRMALFPLPLPLLRIVPKKPAEAKPTSLEETKVASAESEPTPSKK